MRSILILIVLLTLSGCGMSENTKKPDCVVSSVSDTTYRLTIIANQDKIVNEEKFAEEVIEQVRNNDFDTMLFSYDLGYPTSLHMTVFLTREDWHDYKPAMNITVEQEDWRNKYNIVENMEMFQIKIE